MVLSSAIAPSNTDQPEPSFLSNTKLSSLSELSFHYNLTRLYVVAALSERPSGAVGEGNTAVVTSKMVDGVYPNALSAIT